MKPIKKYCVIYGHYGSGKTTIALNMALFLAQQGKSVTLVDLDIVKPYFRSSDYKEMLQEKGIQLIGPTLAGTTLDIPALPAEIYGVTSGQRDHVLFDIGGDDAGAAAFGRFSEMIRSTMDYQAFYVINQYRSFIANPDDALKILREIETMSRLPATGVINNSHLGSSTKEKDITGSYTYADAFSDLSGLPVFMTTVPEHLISGLLGQGREDLFAVKTLVRPPWDTGD